MGIIRPVTPDRFESHRFVGEGPSPAALGSLVALMTDSPADVNIPVVCPSCGHTKCSAMRRDGRVIWNCFRASCQSAGSYTLSRSAEVTVEPPRLTAPKANAYDGTVLPLTEAQLTALKGKFHLHESVLRANIKHNGRRYVLPVYTPPGAVRGYVLRTPWEGTGFEGANSSGPKTLTFMDNGGDPALAWYTDPEEPANYRGRPVVLVEDQISAMRVTEDTYMTGVALLGCGLNDAKIAELQRITARVVLALDSDASATAFRLARKWQHAFESFRVCILVGEDIKTMLPSKVADMLKDFG